METPKTAKELDVEGNKVGLTPENVPEGTLFVGTSGNIYKLEEWMDHKENRGTVVFHVWDNMDEMLNHPVPDSEDVCREVETTVPLGEEVWLIGDVDEELEEENIDVNVDAEIQQESVYSDDTGCGEVEVALVVRGPKSKLMEILEKHGGD